jgi:serine/threonine protein kinase
MLDQATQPYKARCSSTSASSPSTSRTRTRGSSSAPLELHARPSRPSRAAGHGDINVTSDVYSLGATLYYMLTGQSPFGGKDPRAIIKAGRGREAARTPRSTSPTSRARVADRSCMKCLEKKQRDRYPRRAAPRADLEQTLKSGQMVLKAKSLFGKIIGKRKE